MSKKTNIGDWARLSDSLWTKPKVLRIAEILSVQMMLPLADKLTGQMLMRHATCSALSRVFVTVNRHAHPAGDGTNDAVLSDVPADSYLDLVSDMPGIGRAMSEVGWAVYDSAARELRFPNYLEYNNLVKGTGKRGRPGNPDSPAARSKRDQRAKSAPDKSRTNSGQIALVQTDKGADKRTDVDKDEDVEQKPPSPFLVSGMETQPAELEEMKRRVSALREVWQSAQWWTQAEETALVAAWQGLQHLTEEHWLRLRWFFKFSDRKPEDCGGAVTGRRDAFLDNLTGYMQRALSTWTQQGKPDIGLPKPKKRTVPADVSDTSLSMTKEERLKAASDFRSACLANDDLPGKPEPPSALPPPPNMT